MGFPSGELLGWQLKPRARGSLGRLGHGMLICYETAKADMSASSK